MRTILQVVALAKAACNRRCTRSSRHHGTGFAGPSVSPPARGLAEAERSPRSLGGCQNPSMSFSTISALSPLDGRYAGKLAALRPLMSEKGFMHRRVQVEIAWFIALSDAGFAEF